VEVYLVYLKPLLFFLVGLLAVFALSYLAPVGEGKKPPEEAEERKPAEEEEGKREGAD